MGNSSVSVRAGRNLQTEASLRQRSFMTAPLVRWTLGSILVCACGLTIGCAEVAPYHSRRMLSLAHQAERDESDAARAAEQVRGDQSELEQTLAAVRDDAAQARKSASGNRVAPAKTPKSQSKSQVIRRPNHPVKPHLAAEAPTDGSPTSGHAPAHGAEPTPQTLPPAAEHPSK